jgi:hypothetical protein
MSALTIRETEPFRLDDDSRARVQQLVSEIRTPWFGDLHSFPGVPDGFLPWESGLSPSALYNCSLKCRKRMGIKTPETKWMSIRRWITTTPSGIDLPPGVYFSVKRKEEYETEPFPHFVKTEFVLLMFPYGNVWSQREPGAPIDEAWMWGEHGGRLVLELLMRKDAASPVRGYFKRAHAYMRGNPGQIGIHLKRKRRD